jgi:hypothetical protein
VPPELDVAEVEIVVDGAAAGDASGFPVSAPVVLLRCRSNWASGCENSETSDLDEEGAVALGGVLLEALLEALEAGVDAVAGAEGVANATECSGDVWPDTLAGLVLVVLLDAARLLPRAASLRGPVDDTAVKWGRVASCDGSEPSELA